MANWAIFAIPVIAVCVCFFVFYLFRVYPKRVRRKRRMDSEFDLVSQDQDPQEHELPDSWLEYEMLRLAEERMIPDQIEEPAEKDDEEEKSYVIEMTDGEEGISQSDGPVLSEPAKFFHKPYKLTKRDIIPILVVSIIYAAAAFLGLGSKNTPESFAVFENKDSSAVFSLPEGETPVKLNYYTGIGTGKYKIESSVDGTTWNRISEIEQKYSELLKWQTVDFPEGTKNVRYIRITGIGGGTYQLFMGEAALYDKDGKKISLTPNDALSEKLLDEPDIPIVTTNYLYNSYFDEIYHARTAYENILNIYPYEVSHPPLGKLTIGIGIRLFGMNPFGWRFTGTLFGVLMLPIFYIFLKNMFGKTLVATCGTVLFAFDFMHFVQTRIATIDTYGVFFIILMFYFMYRYFTQDYDTPFRKTLLPLFLSGLFFGIGAASKWTVIYGGSGLLAVYVIRQVLRGRYYAKIGKKSSFALYLGGTLMVSILFFIIIPSVIYILSYIPYGTAKGMSIKDGMLWDPDYLNIVWDNQKFMFSYHSKLVATHPYSSPWWQWIIDLRPILYYLHDYGDGTKSAFAAFGNPIVWWTGIGAMISLVIAFLKRRDKLALFIIIGYLAQLIPWIIIPRIAFVYHYFPNVIFIVLGIAFMFNDLCESKRSKISLSVPLLTAAALALFVVFYPVLTGFRVDAGFADTALRWFNGMWPF